MSEPVDVHTWFELSYASYLCVNRSLLQSMPDEWQYRFTALMDELTEHFSNIDEPRYTVHARDDRGRFIKDPIPNYNRGRTFIRGAQQDAKPRCPGCRGRGCSYCNWTGVVP